MKIESYVSSCLNAFVVVGAAKMVLLLVDHPLGVLVVHVSLRSLEIVVVPAFCVVVRYVSRKILRTEEKSGQTWRSHQAGFLPRIHDRLKIDSRFE
jgi:hypothetical protein